jgi:hypothetical protein
MSAADTHSAPTPEMIRELEEAVARLVRGIRDPQVMRRACQRMDQMREEMRHRIGEGEWAVALIREARDDE